MSLMTRNKSDRAKQRTLDAASQVMPMARSAGLAARQSAEDAMAWAAPRVKDARTWAAPRVEQAGIAVRDKIGPAVSEKIAPAISSVLVEAAHRLDTTPPRRRRWPRVLAGFAMAGAAASAAAAIMLRRRPDFASFGMADQAPGGGAAQAPGTGTGTGNGSAVPPATPEEQSADGRRRRSS
jgi:hypothetical protein